MLKRIGMIGMAWMLLIAAPAMSQPAGASPDDNPLPVQLSEGQSENSSESLTLQEEQPREPDAATNHSLIGDFKPLPLGQYWLGIQCAPVGVELRSHLSLPEKQGLMVVGVVKDSPAMKAGLALYDVLLRAGDKPLGNPHDLVQAIEAAKEGKLKLDLIRGGKPQTIELSPVKRPEGVGNQITPPPDSSDVNALQKWMEGIKQGAFGNSPQTFQYRSLVPGGPVILPKAFLLPNQLPPNVSVSISKSSGQPANIVVKRGNDKWEVTENELDKLPADIRPSVEQMLGQSGAGIFGPGTSGVVIGGSSGGSFSSGGTVSPQGGTFQMPMPPGMMQTFSGSGMMMSSQLEKRLEELDRRMERLLEIVEKMHEEHSQNNSSSNQGNK